MQVEDHLPAAPFDIYEEPVAGGCNVEPRRHGLGGEQHFTKNGLIFRREVVDAADVLLRHDQQVHRRLGVDVPEHHHVFCRVQNFGGHLPANDLAKHTRLFHVR